MPQETTEYEAYRAKYKEWVAANFTPGFMANDGEKAVAWAMYQKLRPFIPPAGSPEAEKAIEDMMALYEYPCNPQANARIGWEAARNYR